MTVFVETCNVRLVVYIQKNVCFQCFKVIKICKFVNQFTKVIAVDFNFFNAWNFQYFSDIQYE